MAVLILPVTETVRPRWQVVVGDGRYTFGCVAYANSGAQAHWAGANVPGTPEPNSTLQMQVAPASQP